MLVSWLFLAQCYHTRLIKATPKGGDYIIETNIKSANCSNRLNPPKKTPANIYGYIWLFMVNVTNTFHVQGMSDVIY